MTVKNQTGSMFDVERLTTLDAILALEAEWTELHANSIWPSVYNTFIFLSETLQAFGRESSLWRFYLLRERTSKQLIAIFPWELRLGHRAKLAYNTLQTACLNEIMDKPYPIIRNSFHQTAWQEILNYLNSVENDWHHLFLRDVPQGNPALEDIQILCKKLGFLYQRHLDSESPQISLTGNWDNFKQKHRSLRRKLNRLEKDFGDRVKFTIKNDYQDSYLDTYVGLERKTWKSGSGITRDKKTTHFYRSLCKRLAGSNQLLFAFLTVDDQTIASEITYLFGDKAYFPQACFDPDFARYSPSMVMTAFMVRHLYETPFQSGDYLTGYAQYLNEWSDEILITYDIDIYRPCFVIQLIEISTKIKQIIGQLKSRLNTINDEKDKCLT